MVCCIGVQRAGRLVSQTRLFVLTVCYVPARLPASLTQFLCCVLCYSQYSVVWG